MSSDIYIRNIDPAVKTKLTAMAENKGMSLNALVKTVLEDYVIMPDIRPF